MPTRGFVFYLGITILWNFRHKSSNKLTLSLADKNTTIQATRATVVAQVEERWTAKEMSWVQTSTRMKMTSIVGEGIAIKSPVLSEEQFENYAWNVSCKNLAWQGLELVVFEGVKKKCCPQVKIENKSVSKNLKNRNIDWTWKDFI